MNEILQVVVNGDPREVGEGTTVADMVAALGLKPMQVAVERNKVIVRRQDHAGTYLEDGDVLEVVTFFGGG